MSKKLQATVLIVVTVCLCLAFVTVRQQLLAQPNGGGAAPALISFQGFLADSNSDPLPDGTYDMAFGIYDAASGGTTVWQESQSGVAVSGGFFSVMLGSGSCTMGCPLSADTFTDATRYLQTSVDTGSGLVDFPRQQLGSAPYALQAEQADMANTADSATTADSANTANSATTADSAATAATADSAPWSGLTGVPAGFADGIDDTGNQYQNVIIVALSGGDYTSVAEALDSITDASATNPYLVQVMAGEYTETDLVQVQGYVHLQGSGPQATIVTSARSSATPSNNSATAQLDDNGRISNLTIRNEGTSTFGIAIYSSGATRAGVVDTVRAEAIGSGTGGGRYAVYMNDAEATIRNSVLFAGGVTGFGSAVNAAFGSVNAGGGFPQALIENSILIGGMNNNMENCNDSTGTGFGMQLSNSSPIVRHSYVCGGHRGIVVLVNGHAQLQNGSVKVSSTSQAYLFEITASGSIKIANSGVAYVGNKFTGAGTGLSCVHTYDLGTYAPLTDAINSSANACD